MQYSYVTLGTSSFTFSIRCIEVETTVAYQWPSYVTETLVAFP